MRTLAIALVYLGALLALASVGFWIAAVWVVGPNSMRCSGTAFALDLIAVVSIGVGGWNLDGEL